MLSIENLCHGFVQGGAKVDVLIDCDLTLNKGEIVALVGESGAGKTTFLQIAGLLERPKSGEIVLNGVNTGKLNDNERTALRRDFFGFVYQFHHLLPEFSALENAAMPRLIAGAGKMAAREKALGSLKALGLGHRSNHRPNALSGGERQRVAIARALANDPSILLADEPTGNLDPTTSLEVFNLILNLAKERNVAALIATHNMELARMTHRTISLRGGAIVEL